MKVTREVTLTVRVTADIPDDYPQKGMMQSTDWWAQDQLQFVLEGAHEYGFTKEIQFEILNFGCDHE